MIFFSEQLVTIDDQTLQDIFLLLDEVPCNSDPGIDKTFYGKPSGDWKGLKRNGVNLMMALKPIENSGFSGIFSNLIDKIISRKIAIDLYFPEDIAHLKLNRIYRCTKNIAEFYEEIVTHVNQPEVTGRNYGINSSSISNSPGHEIHGDRPEVLLLSRCICFGFCKNPVEHLFQANRTKILAMIKRIQSKFTKLEVTVLIETFKDDQKCVNWLKTELKEEDGAISNIVFKTIGQCRGLEFPVLLTIDDGGSNYRLEYLASASTTLDTWTRVTASLFIIQINEEYSSVTQGLKNCVKNQVAKQAEEQEEIKYNLLRKLCFNLQNPLFIIIAGALGYIFFIILTALFFISAFI